MKDVLIKEFQDRFSASPQHLFFCPGRVNLIGEHIDYNGGHVMPCAISRGTWLAISKNTEKLLRFRSLDFEETADLHLQSSYSKTGSEWYNYPLGMINQLLHEGYDLSGLDMLFSGDLPVAAGLSSSAAIEVLTGFTLSEIFALEITRGSLALMGKQVENEFIGVSSGIMDQFAVAMGKKDHAILLNCDTLEYEYLPFHTGQYQLVIINSNKQRALADSKYNERFRECGAALKLLKQELDVTHLCDIDPATFALKRHLINDPVLEKRALHVISEQARVKDAAIVLKTGDTETFGKLMYASHLSLKELYEVSGKELDTIVDFSITFPGCIGARMTGAGFGGCAIALVDKDRIDVFSIHLAEHYKRSIGYNPEIFPAAVTDGVTRL